MCIRDRNNIRSDVELIKKILKNSGYYFSEIDDKIIENDNNNLVYIANIEPEVTKQDFINSFKNVNYLWI